MAIQLYRPGNTHIVRGVECELKNFHAHEQTDQINAGWYQSPGEWDIEQTKSDQEEVKYAKSNPNHPTRVAAKEAGIDGWDTKRLSTLEALLDGTEE